MEVFGRIGDKTMEETKILARDQKDGEIRYMNYGPTKSNVPKVIMNKGKEET